jgi:hypothetical protein
MFNLVPSRYKEMSFVSNGGKFKLYTVPNGLLFSTPTQPKFSFERMIEFTIEEKNVFECNDTLVIKGVVI